LERDWLDHPWLFEGLLRIPELTRAEREKIVALRRAAVRRAVRAQLRRVLTGRLTGDLPRYLAYRARASRGQAPLLAPGLIR
jgi:hypothetical protein